MGQASRTIGPGMVVEPVTEVNFPKAPVIDGKPFLGLGVGLPRPAGDSGDAIGFLVERDRALATQQISRGLKRLRPYGVIKQVPRTFKHHLTDFGRRVVVSSLALSAATIIPAIARAAAS